MDYLLAAIFAFIIVGGPVFAWIWYTYVCKFTLKRVAENRERIELLEEALGLDRRRNANGDGE